MDSRHYSSLLVLIGMVAVAWVMSQVPPGRRVPDDWDSETNLAQTAAVDRATEPPHSPDPTTESATREVSAEEARPRIPRLLAGGDSWVAPIQSAGGEEASTGPSQLGTDPSHSAANPPLRSIAFGSPPNSGTWAADAPPLGADSAGVPSFSMPNSLPSQRPSTGDRLGGEFAGQVDATAAGSPTAGGRPTAGGSGSRLLAGSPPLGPVAGSAGGAEVGPPSQLLPGNRHVLRPIIRGPAATTTLPADFAAATTSPAAPSASDWGAPMPGVKSRAGTERRLPSSTEPISVLEQPREPRERPATTAWPLATDPELVQAAEELYRLPAATAAETAPPRGLAPRSNPRAARASADYIWHVIQKNQSLESISFQYQGDASLVPRLRQLNADILVDPNLLPIGRAIRVPVR